MEGFPQERLNVDLKMMATYNKKINNNLYISTTFFKDNSKLDNILKFCKKLKFRYIITKQTRLNKHIFIIRYL